MWADESPLSAYPLVTRELNFAGRNWQITSVEDQDALMGRVKTDEDLANFPYGLLLWPSALGLAQALTDHSSLVRGARVLEIGCGIGLAGLAAHALGAAQVRQTDYHIDALALARRNAQQNDIAAVETLSGDWRDFPDALVGNNDLVVGSDVLYERSLHGDLERLLPRLLAPGGTIFLSDPLRPQALAFVQRLEDSGAWRLEMDERRVDFRGEPKDIALFTLRWRA